MSVPRSAVDAAPPRRRLPRAVAGPPPTSEGALADGARRVLAASRSVLPPAWTAPGFAQEVELVRRQLAPLRDRRMLAASYERESARIAALRRLVAEPSAPPAAASAVDVAYAIRWLELGEVGPSFPAWPAPVPPRAPEG